MTLAAQVDKLKQRFGLSRVVLVGGCAHRWSQLWHTRVLAQDKRQMRLRRRGTDGLSTHRWREMDSNQWYGGTEKLPSAAPVSGPTLPRMPERGIMTSQLSWTPKMRQVAKVEPCP